MTDMKIPFTIAVVVCAVVSAIYQIAGAGCESGAPRPKRVERLEILYLVCLGIGGLLYNIDSSKWNYTDSTNWVVGGEVTYGPAANFLISMFVGVVFAGIISYIAGRIVKAIFLHGK